MKFESEKEIENKLRNLLNNKGFFLWGKYYDSFDIVFENNGKRTGIEIKYWRLDKRFPFARALGQLLVGKYRHKTNEEWLVVNDLPSFPSTEHFIKIFNYYNIRIFRFDGKDLEEIKQV